MNKNKIIIIINGKGGVGKDTLCDFTGDNFKITNVSSITPIKEIASIYGWNGEKNNNSRKFLSNLKKAFTDYNDLPLEYLKMEYKKFLNAEKEILFVHIREAEEIKRFVEFINNEGKIKCKTLLIKRNEIDNQKIGNISDDNVDEYTYDYIFENNDNLIEVKNKFINFIKDVVNQNEN